MKKKKEKVDKPKQVRPVHLARKAKQKQRDAEQRLIFALLEELAQRGDVSALQRLTELTAHPEPRFRREAFRIRLRLGSEDLNLLIQALNDASQEVRRIAVKQATQSPAEALVPHLVPLLTAKGGLGEAAQQAIRSCQPVQEECLKELLAALHSASARLSNRAARALNYKHSNESILLELLRAMDCGEAKSSKAVRAALLGFRRREPLRQAMLTRLQAKITEVQINALWVLARLHNPKDHAVFSTFLRHPEPRLQLVACLGLRGLGDQADLAAMRELLEQLD